MSPAIQRLPRDAARIGITCQCLDCWFVWTSNLGIAPRCQLWQRKGGALARMKTPYSPLLAQCSFRIGSCVVWSKSYCCWTSLYQFNPLHFSGQNDQLVVHVLDPATDFSKRLWQCGSGLMMDLYWLDRLFHTRLPLLFPFCWILNAIGTGPTVCFVLCKVPSIPMILFDDYDNSVILAKF